MILPAPLVFTAVTSRPIQILPFGLYEFQSVAQPIAVDSSRRKQQSQRENSCMMSTSIPKSLSSAVEVMVTGEGYISQNALTGAVDASAFPRIFGIFI